MDCSLACSPGHEGVRENTVTSLKRLSEKPCPQVSVRARGEGYGSRGGWAHRDLAEPGGAIWQVQWRISGVRVSDGRK